MTDFTKYPQCPYTDEDGVVTEERYRRRAEAWVRGWEDAKAGKECGWANGGLTEGWDAYHEFAKNEDFHKFVRSKVPGQQRPADESGGQGTGRVKFNREQLTLVATAVMDTAVTAVLDQSPMAGVDWDRRVVIAGDTDENPRKMLEGERHALKAVGNSLANLFARVTGEGITGEDALQAAGDFYSTISEWIESIWGDGGHRVQNQLQKMQGSGPFKYSDVFRKYPDVGRHANAFVDGIMHELDWQEREDEEQEAEEEYVDCSGQCVYSVCRLEQKITVVTPAEAHRRIDRALLLESPKRRNPVILAITVPFGGGNSVRLTVWQTYFNNVNRVVMEGSLVTHAGVTLLDVDFGRRFTGKYTLSYGNTDYTVEIVRGD